MAALAETFGFQDREAASGIFLQGRRGLSFQHEMHNNAREGAVTVKRFFK
jgi:hypothetical protein